MSPVKLRVGTAQRMVTGPESVRALQKMRDLQARRDEWPYEYLFPPPNSQGRRPSSSLVSPGPGGVARSAVVLTFPVPSGFQFILDGLMMVYTGAGFVEGDGSVLWTVDKNTPLGGGALQGSPIVDLTNVPTSWGSIAVGPIPLGKPELFAPLDVIRVKVSLTAAIPAGVPNFFAARLTGWIWPALE